MSSVTQGWVLSADEWGVGILSCNLTLAHLHRVQSPIFIAHLWAGPSQAFCVYEKTWQGTYSTPVSPKVPLCALLRQHTPFITTPLSLGWDRPLLACLPLNLHLDFCKCLLWLNLLCTDYHIHVKFSSFAYLPTDIWTKNTVNLPSLLPSETWNLSAVKAGIAPV